MHFIDAIGFLGGFLNTYSSIPQICKMIQTKHTEDVSTSMIIIWGIGCICSTIYGIYINQSPIYISSIISLLLATTMLVVKFKFKHNTQNYILYEETQSIIGNFQPNVETV